MPKKAAQPQVHQKYNFIVDKRIYLSLLHRFAFFTSPSDDGFLAIGFTMLQAVSFISSQPLGFTIIEYVSGEQKFLMKLPIVVNAGSKKYSV